MREQQGVRQFLEVRIERCFLTFRWGLRKLWKRRPELFSSVVRQIISFFNRLALDGGDASHDKEVSEKLTVEGLD